MHDETWLYSSGVAATALFDGSSSSVLQTLVKYFHWFCDHPGISKAALSSVLALQQNILPPGNKLHTSYETALAAIEPYLVKAAVYDVCQNDCVVFTGQHGSLLECPKCGSQRFVSKKSSIPVKRFTYLPLKSCLRRLFGDSNMAESDPVFDIHQSLVWRKAYSETGLFKGDGRGTLALCTDGVNPLHTTGYHTPCDPSCSHY